MSASDPSAAAVAGAAPAGAAGAPAKAGSVSSWTTKKLLTSLRLINMLNGLLLVATGILVFITGIVGITFSTITVAAYVVFFGLMMTCLECNVGNLAPKFKKNFGFMFSFIGRTLFILFCATMCFALAAWLGYLAGSITAREFPPLGTRLRRVPCALALDSPASATLCARAGGSALAGGTRRARILRREAEPRRAWPFPVAKGASLTLHGCGCCGASLRKRTACASSS